MDHFGVQRVQVHERVPDVHGDLELGPVPRELRHLAQRVLLDGGLERAAGHELEHEGEVRLLPYHAVERDHVRVVQARHHHHLGLEAP